MPGIDVIIRDSDGKYPKYAWPGGYPIGYVMGDNGMICGDCANGKNHSLATTADSGEPDRSWKIVAYIILEEESEDGPIVCDHCNKEIV